ncbi:MAG: ankyrin repeat domain-containing protein [Sphingomonadaceae bacterium]|nr:ankyrin repeat domain-containing protein [Sphingomonadaceae bacterium]
MRLRTLALVVPAVLAAQSPAAAQFSDSYNLIKAVHDKDVAKAREILDKPGSTAVNAREASTGDAPIHIVVKDKDLGWLGFLVQASADINARDRDGNTPLMLAAAGRWTEGTQLLIAIRADVNRRNNGGETALIKAVQVGDPVGAKLLLDAGANPDQTDSLAGHSARDYAQQKGGAIARLLADAPAKPKAPVQGPVR